MTDEVVLDAGAEIGEGVFFFCKTDISDQTTPFQGTGTVVL